MFVFTLLVWGIGAIIARLSRGSTDAAPSGPSDSGPQFV